MSVVRFSTEPKSESTTIDGNPKSFFPWVNLAPELHIQIFRHAISGSMAMTPLALSRICQSWRQIAFHACELWTNVDLALEVRRYRAQVTLLEQWLDRALGLPLSLKVSCVRGLGIGSVTIPLLVQVLAKKSPQISSLSLGIPVVFYNCLADFSWTWPILSQLSLSTRSVDDSVAVYPDSLRVFEPSPQLTTVSIKFFYISSFKLPPAHLISLRLELVAPFEILQALHWFPNLEELYVGKVFISDERDNELPLTITHQKLKHLTLDLAYKGVENSETRRSWKRLYLPALTSLIFILPVFDSRGPPRVRRCMDFAPNSLSKLEKLVVRSGCVDIGDLTQFMHDRQALRSLELCHCLCIGGDIGGFITMMLDGSAVMPCLQNFEFRGDVDFSPQVLVQALEKRWDRADDKGSWDSLESVTFEGRGAAWVITEEHNQRFEGWKHRGFSIDIQ